MRRIRREPDRGGRGTRSGDCGRLAADLLKVTATYHVTVGQQGQRAVLVYLYDAATGKVREQLSTIDLPWDDTPEDVRDLAIQHGERTVSFTIYPVGQQRFISGDIRRRAPCQNLVGSHWRHRSGGRPR